MRREEDDLKQRNGGQAGGLVLTDTDTYGGVSDLADEVICVPRYVGGGKRRGIASEKAGRGRFLVRGIYQD